MALQSPTLELLGGQAGGFNPSIGLYFNNATGLLEYARTANVFKSVSLAATGNIWTPASGKKFRLMMIQYQIPEQTTISGGAELTVKLQDGSGNDIGINFVDWCPTTVPASATGDNHTILYLPGNGYLSAAADRILVANFSASLTAGHVAINAIGTEE